MAEVCRGHAGSPACDGSGTLYQCDDNGLIASQTSCGSAELCQPGLMTGACATCVPNAFRCTGAALEQCDPMGVAFRQLSVCSSPELCSPAQGRCSDASCRAGEQTCMGDALYRCKADLTGFEKQQDCARGLCDQAAGTCDACLASSARCMGNVALTCDAQGSRESAMTCPELCEAGRCVECIGSTTESCGMSDRGECNLGRKTCRNGSWGTCTGATDPTAETCNNKDDNCDGQVDNGATCPLGQGCSAGKCVCRTDSECSFGEICAQGSCARPYVTCGASCPAGFRCNYGLCVPECTTAASCPTLSGFRGMSGCGVELGLSSGCVLVCEADSGGLVNLPQGCPSGTTCEPTGVFWVCST